MPIRTITNGMLTRAAHAARRASHGLLFAAAGTRRLDDFKRASSDYFADFNAAPQEIASGFNALEERVYRRHVRPGSRVCVMGCGTGRDVLPFVEQGCDVTGVDPAPSALAMLRLALEQRHKTATLITGCAEDVTLTGSFDAVILAPHCYSYVPGTIRRVQLLASLARHLNGDGRILINFLRRTGAWSARGVRIAQTVARLTGSDCPWEPHDIAQLSDINGSRTITFEHFFLPSEVAHEAEQAGLRVVDAEVDDFLGPLTVVGR